MATHGHRRRLSFLGTGAQFVWLKRRLKLPGRLQVNEIFASLSDKFKELIEKINHTFYVRFL